MSTTKTLVIGASAVGLGLIIGCSTAQKKMDNYSISKHYQTIQTNEQNKDLADVYVDSQRFKELQEEEIK